MWKKTILISFLLSVVAFTEIYNVVDASINDVHYADINADGEINTSDVVHLLYSLMFGSDDYPLYASNKTMINGFNAGDVNGDTLINTSDTIHMLYHVMFGEDAYPLYGKEKITVGENGKFKSLQEAVDYADAGDIIYLEEGTFEGATINKYLEIRGNNYNVNPNGIRKEETIIKSDLIINASNVTINGIEITNSAKFTFDNLSSTVENIKFLYCKVTNSMVNSNGERSIAPFNLVSNNDNIIKNVLIDHCYIDRVSSGRPMAMYLVDVENITIQNSVFLGGSNRASFNDAIKVDDLANGNANFGIKGDVIIQNNTFKEYYQYAIWFRQYSDGNYLIQNNTFDKIGQTKDSHAAINFIKNIDGDNVSIKVLSNEITNGYLLFRIDKIEEQLNNISCVVNENVLINCNGTYYIKSSTDGLLINATKNYYGTDKVENNKFVGNIDYSDYYQSLYEIPGHEKMELLYETTPYVDNGKTINILYECYGFEKSKVKWVSTDESIAAVTEDGKVIGLKAGTVQITAYVEELGLEEQITVIVYENIQKMPEVAQYVLSIMNSYSYSVTAANSCRNYAVSNPYLYSIYRGATKYLFEDLVIDTDSYARDGTAPLINNKVEYITIHDTWGMAKNAEGLAEYFLNDITSVHYTTGNDGIFQIIRLTDKGAHAGDSPYRAYALEKTNVLATTDNPVITMIDGYLTINGIKTELRPYTDYEGTIQDMTNYTTSQITYSGIRCVIGDDGYYYLGKTYFNDTYKTISNFGGNANSIGIEIESRKGIDFFWNMQKTAKLVAMLMDKFDLTTNDVKMHNYFSGKNCAQLLKNNLKYEYNYQIDKHKMEDTLWDEFLELCDVELKMLEYNKQYKFELISSDTSLLTNTGRVIGHTNSRECVPYTIRITNISTNEVIELQSAIIIPSSTEIDPCYINR
ncbi:MAG: N-acetylmuramoyl-L-alanine amidase [Bacilli bacterium]|nr:N-acetylmuramoyl-L-alanine amidase [Bacilli bacterium]